MSCLLYIIYIEFSIVFANIFFKFIRIVTYYKNKAYHMSNIVKYSVKPETAAAVLDAAAGSERPLERSEIAEKTGFSLMTVGKAADMFVSAGVFLSSAGNRRESGRKPELLSLSDAVLATVYISYADCYVYVCGMDGTVKETLQLEKGRDCGGLFSLLLSVSEKHNCLGASVLCSDTYDDGIPKSSYFGAYDPARTVSAALKAPVFTLLSSVDIAARNACGNDKILYLTAENICFPSSRLVSGEGVSRTGDISAILNDNPTEEEIGNAAALSALLCRVRRLVIYRGTDKMIKAASAGLSGRIPINSADEIDFAACAISRTRSELIKEICASSRI